MYIYYVFFVWSLVDVSLQTMRPIVGVWISCCREVMSLNVMPEICVVWQAILSIYYV